MLIKKVILTPGLGNDNILIVMMCVVSTNDYGEGRGMTISTTESSVSLGRSPPSLTLGPVPFAAFSDEILNSLSRS